MTIPKISFAMLRDNLSLLDLPQSMTDDFSRQLEGDRNLFADLFVYNAH